MVFKFCYFYTLFTRIAGININFKFNTLKKLFLDSQPPGKVFQHQPRTLGVSSFPQKYPCFVIANIVN